MHRQKEGLNMRRSGLLVLAMLCLAGVAWAQEAGNARMEDLDRQIEELERRREELEREREEARRMAEEKERFGDIQNESRERIAHLREELNEIEGEAQEGEQETPAFAAFRKARVAHINALMALDKRVLALKRPADLPAAVRLRREWEKTSTHWWMVLEPKLGGAATLAEMQKVVAEVGNLPGLVKLVGELKARYQETLKTSEMLYKLWVAREDAMYQWGQKEDEFWQRVEDAENNEGDNELPD